MLLPVARNVWYVRFILHSLELYAFGQVKPVDVTLHDADFLRSLISHVGAD